MTTPTTVTEKEENLERFMFVVVPDVMYGFIRECLSKKMTKKEVLAYAKEHAKTDFSKKTEELTHWINGKDKQEAISWINSHEEEFSMGYGYRFYLDNEDMTLLSFGSGIANSMHLSGPLEYADKKGLHLLDLANAINTLNMEETERPDMAERFKSLIKGESDKLWAGAREFIQMMRKVDKI